jgi:pimeloyl-ACP methyl ester carboxylesterase
VRRSGVPLGTTAPGRGVTRVLHLLPLLLTLAEYGAVNGLKMYYEVHGQGPPLLLLHGGTATVATSFATIIPAFAGTHKLIAPEQMGHGHTADANRPLDYAAMADDTDALLEQLGVVGADVLGISDGGEIALYLAGRHPRRVRKLIVMGAGFSTRDPVALMKWADKMTPREWPPSDTYKAMSPDGVGHWPLFLKKVLTLYKTWPGLSPSEIAAIRAPTMIVIGDRDEVSLEQAAQMRRALPGARVCVLPDTVHQQLVKRTDWLQPMIAAFLAEPMPVSPPTTAR